MNQKLVNQLISLATKKTQYEKTDDKDFLPFNCDEYEGYNIGIDDGKIELARIILSEINIKY